MAEADKGLIDVKRDGDLALFDYSFECQITKTWNVFTKSARGLVLDLAARRVAALPFPKFFNFEEHKPEEIPALPFEVYEKYDGSLGIIYYYEGKWRVNTRGSFNSDQAVWGKQWLDANLHNLALRPELTYLAELIYPENRIVVNYRGFSGVAFLAAYNTSSGKEVPPAGIPSAMIGRRYDNFENMAAIIEAAKALPGNEEGWVIRFSNGFRVKIKGEQYKTLHRMVTNLSAKRIWESLAAGLKVSDFLPDDFYDQWAHVVETMQSSVDHARQEVYAVVESVRNLPTRKEQALAIQKELPSNLYGAAFSYLDNKHEQCREALWKSIKPAN